jgi:hypothetical protein
MKMEALNSIEELNSVIVSDEDVAIAKQLSHYSSAIEACFRCHQHGEIDVEQSISWVFHYESPSNTARTIRQPAQM